MTSSLRQDSMNSSIVMTPSWFRSSFLKTRSTCSLAFRSSSTWWARRPINSWTATTISESSARLMQPSPLTSYNLKVHLRRSYTEPRRSVESVMSKSCWRNGKNEFVTKRRFIRKCLRYDQCDWERIERGLREDWGVTGVTTGAINNKTGNVTFWRHF